MLFFNYEAAGFGGGPLKTLKVFSLFNLKSYIEIRELSYTSGVKAPRAETLLYRL